MASDANGTLEMLSAVFAESSVAHVDRVDTERLFHQQASTQDAFDDDCLLHRLGGDGTLINGLRHFFELVMDDPVLAPFLDGLDISDVKNSFTKFLTLLLGNKLPADFDVSLYLMEQQYHYYQKRLAVSPDVDISTVLIDQEHYDLFLGYLPEACEEIEMEQSMIDELMDIFLPFGKAFNDDYRDRKIRHVLLRTAQHKIDERLNQTKRTPMRGVGRSSSSEGIIGRMSDAAQRRRPSNKSGGRTERSQSLKISESGGGGGGGSKPKPKNHHIRTKGRSKSVNTESLADELPPHGASRRRSGDHIKSLFSFGRNASQLHLDEADLAT